MLTFAADFAEDIADNCCSCVVVVAGFGAASSFLADFPACLDCAGVDSDAVD